MKILISSKPCGVPEFYDLVAREMGRAVTKHTKYDCTEINIAANIQDGFYEYYTQVAREIDPTLSEEEIRVNVTMLLAMSGPKVDKELKDNEVEVFEGFIC